MTNLSRRPLIVASTLLGLGLGGFVDGILLHQILQWHHMLSSAGVPPDNLANLEINTLWGWSLPWCQFTWIPHHRRFVLALARTWSA